MKAGGEVLFTTGRRFNPANLRWYRAHAQEIEKITIVKNPVLGGMDNGAIVRIQALGWRAEMEWGSFRLAVDWAKRPTLRHAQLFLSSPLITHEWIGLERA